MSNTAAAEKTEEKTAAHTVWVGEKDKIASFHPVENYQLQTFTCHDQFINYLRFLQECGFRFQ